MKTSLIVQKVLIIFTVILLTDLSVYSQKVEDLFVRTGPEVVWLGIDFTQVKLFGDLGTVGEDELIPLFNSINRLIISERSKYDFAAALRKNDIPFDLEMVTRLNSSIDPERIISYSSTEEKRRLNEDVLSMLVRQYSVANNDGIGLVFFMEALDKRTERASMWVTFFNLADRNILFTEWMSGTAGGFGFRNHWARTVYEVIDQIRNEKYAEWRYRYTR